MFSLVSCSKKAASKPTVDIGDLDQKVLIVPCSISESKDFGPSDKAFRASAMGQSMDQMTSKRKAMTEARAQLAGNIETTIKSVVDNYIKDVNMNEKENLEKKYEGITREVINQQLNDVKVICEKQAITRNSNNITTYIALEMDKDAVVKALASRVSRDEELKVDYDYEKFKKTFDEEMSKMK